MVLRLHQILKTKCRPWRSAIEGCGHLGIEGDKAKAPFSLSVDRHELQPWTTTSGEIVKKAETERDGDGDGAEPLTLVHV